jgi:hypothetical protein
MYSATFSSIDASVEVAAKDVLVSADPPLALFDIKVIDGPNAFEDLDISLDAFGFANAFPKEEEAPSVMKTNAVENLILKWV